jgi:uncharacterized protein (TIGR01777 family)
MDEQNGGRIVIAGGSGFLGKLLAGWFTEKGNEVVVLGRSERTPRDLPRKAAYRRWDGVRGEGGWAEALEGAAAVINVAGRSVNCRYTAANRREMMESRVESTRAIGEAVARCAKPPPMWINSSTATIYRHSLDRTMDEEGETGATAEARDAFSVEIARAWERAFFEARIPEGVTRTALRTAIVLADEPGTMFAIVGRLARLGLGGRMGSGRQKVSWIHATDFCRAVSFVMEKRMEGVVNVAAPQPEDNGRMMALFREVAGVRMGLPAARWMLEVGALVIRTETELVLKSRNVVPGRLVRAGFRFEHGEMGEAIRDLWKAGKGSGRQAATSGGGGGAGGGGAGGGAILRRSVC